jgi:hypothetical protein
MIQSTTPTFPRKWRDPQPTIFVRHVPLKVKSRAGVEYTRYVAFGFTRKA